VGGSTGGSGGTSDAGGSVGGSGSGVCDGLWQCQNVSAGAQLVLVPTGDTCPSRWSPHAPLYTDDDPSCEPCTCAASTGECNSMDVMRYSDSGCGTLKDSQDSLADNTCVDVHELYDSDQAHSYFATVNPENEACAPSAGASEALLVAQLCDLASAPPVACPGEAECIPVVDSSAGQVCELLVGDVACPSGKPAKRLIYGAVTDFRTCQCACGAVNGGHCTGASIWLADPADCGGSSWHVTPAGSCRDTSDYLGHDGYIARTGSYASGDCAPSVVTSGSVTFDQPHSLCCVD